MKCRIKKLAFSIVLLLINVPGTLYAALAPYYQTSQEITAILTHPKVIAALSPNQIDSITKKATGYVLQSGICQLEITVKPTLSKNNVIGSLPFELQVLEKICDDIVAE